MSEERILIAEDNEIVAQALHEQLTALGYNVIGVARDGAEALRVCERERPDLLILDMQMPDPTGDVAAQLAERAPTPIVVITGPAEGASIRKAEEAGVLAYLVKPIKPEELPPAINIALARFREVRQLRQRIDELQETLDARKLIERAKGILMKRQRISDAEAEERLRQRAQEKNVPIKNIAQTIIESDALLS